LVQTLRDYLPLVHARDFEQFPTVWTLNKS